MDQKQLSQLDPKLKAVYDRVMGIANTPPPTPPQIATPPPPPAPPIAAQMPQAPQRPTFVVEEVGNPTTAPQTPAMPVSPSTAVPPPPPPPHTTQPHTFFTQDTGAIPTFRPAPQPMQSMHATMPVHTSQTGVAPQGGSHVFMILFIILGIIFFVLYGVFWVQLFNIGIPALTQ